MPDAFVWYHADASRKEDILRWLDSLSASWDLQVRLYRRTAHGQTTYMEVYEHIEPETLAEIERLAPAGASLPTSSATPRFLIGLQA
ncbi:MAG: hypothetical protein D6703_01715 [Zetaproteobacteria bacterium]|nr:MAG: hypothetical protein D6703_01715 [Zetaproteobacteria bacterium]